MREIERRTLAAAGLEVRKKGGDESVPQLVGYGAVFNSESEDLGNFREKIMPGAFDRALRENQEVLCRAEHDSGLLLGRRSNGTLRLSVDATGLRYEVDVPDTQAGRDTVTLTKRGDLCRSSFAFRIPDREGAETWARCADGMALRELHDLDLVDVAPVADPAYRATTVSARALEQARSLAAPPEKTKAQTRAEAIERFRAARKPEKREMAYEEKLEALWCALYDLLGSPWDGDGCWSIEATFDDRVIVERQPGQYQAYPISFDAANALTIGPPTAVVAQYVPVAADAGAAEAGSSEARALELARLEFGI